MRIPLMAASLLLLAGTAAAQDSTITIRAEPERAARLDPRALPRDVATEVIRFYNDPSALHFSGRTRIPPGRGVDGDVVVLGGPVSVSGRISGHLVVINGDVDLEPGATVGGDILVVGGVLRGDEDADIAGEIRTYREILRYRRTGDELTYAPERELLPRWARRLGRDDDDRSRSDFLLALGGTYNRVEGAPIQFGPRVDAPINDAMRFQGEVIGIIRSGRNFALETGDAGYRLRGELLFGNRRSNLGVGLRAYDVAQSVEAWPFRGTEAGWGAFLFHSDYRDFYRRQGASVYATLRPSREASLTLEGRDERHHSMDARDPWTIFRSEVLWRANPAITDGRFRSATTTLRLDTRNDRAEPTAGILLTAEFEAARGTDLTGPIDPTLVCVTAPCQPSDYADGRLDYRRGWIDARTYLRITPGGRLNLRAAGGGWLGGDRLPVQRRASLGGPDPLPGYDFREMACGGRGVNGAPALCDRAMVFQAEFRTHLGLDFGPDWVNDWGDGDDYMPFHVSGPDIVVFADAGRAWTVGGAPGDFAADRLPSLASLFADVGLGLDFGPVGLYLAKAVGSAGGGRDVTFSVRLGRRF